MDQPLTADHFKPHIGKAFKVKDGPHELTLAAVDLRRLEPHEAALFTRPPFTLTFSGPPREVLPQGMYALDVAEGTSFEIYLIPILTPVRTRQDYQSVFN